MANSGFKMGSSASAVLAALVAISSMVSADVFSDQSRVIRLLIAVGLGIFIGAVVFLVAKRLGRQA